MTRPERRVFEGKALEFDDGWAIERPGEELSGNGRSHDGTWLGGLQGKRVVLVVEVLDDAEPKEGA